MRALLVLLNGLTTKKKLSSSSLSRVEKAVENLKKKDLLILSTGYTINKSPKRNKWGYPLYEANAAADYLIKHHKIDPARIIIENYSKDTIGNIYFSKIMHMDPLGINNVVVVTSKFHAARVDKICGWIFNLRPNAGKINFTILSSENPSFSAKTSEHLKKKEAAKVKKIIALASIIKTKLEFHEWIYTEHYAYNNAIKRPLKDSLIREVY